jgi:urea carboxylase
VYDVVFEASYMVLGLGDVYLGAPVATPIDPRHRLVTTKYNPARTWTPENAVGIGGAYMCVYGMEGPGGYQFVGRTVQMWNRWRQTAQLPRRQAVAAALLRPDPLLRGQRGRTAAPAPGLPARAL